MKNAISILLLHILMIWHSDFHAQTVTDADGNVYNTINIGKQLGTFAVHSKKSDENRLQIMDIFGKTIIEMPFKETMELTLENKGVYLIRLIGETEVMTQKLIIQ